ncbi:MAG: hypothetical protein LBP85_00635, partial [Prevotellaceae bacterium]|nr:hypothetical protein [Prevotellaceae bacterium]
LTPLSSASLRLLHCFAFTMTDKPVRSDEATRHCERSEANHLCKSLLSVSSVCLLTINHYTKQPKPISTGLIMEI